MCAEVSTAVNFVTGFLFNKLPRRKIALFAEQLSEYLLVKFQNHWYPDQPYKGSAFRCIRISCTGLTDALIGAAAQSVGLQVDDVLELLPSELTIWVDPGEVSYRFGEYGSIQGLYSAVGSSSGSGDSASSYGDYASPRVTTGQSYLQTPPSVYGSGSSGSSCGTPDGSPPPQPTLYDWPLAASKPQPPAQPTMVGSGTGGGSGGPQPANDTKFTVGSFAMTRFGTTKLKTSVLQAMKHWVPPPPPPNPWASQVMVPVGGAGAYYPGTFLQNEGSFFPSSELQLH